MASASRRLCRSGAEVISLGRCHDLARARADYPHLVFQGNVDEEVLRGGTRAGGGGDAGLPGRGRRRHVVNLNHGVDRATPVANFEAFVDTVRASGR